MVNKRMERAAKLQLVTQLGLVQVAVQLGGGLGDHEDDCDVALAVSGLLNALMHELVAALVAAGDARAANHPDGGAWPRVRDARCMMHEGRTMHDA
jgi:hypothetical protein